MIFPEFWALHRLYIDQYSLVPTFHASLARCKPKHEAQRVIRGLTSGAHRDRGTPAWGATWALHQVVWVWNCWIKHEKTPIWWLKTRIFPIQHKLGVHRTAHFIFRHTHGWSCWGIKRCLKDAGISNNPYRPVVVSCMNVFLDIIGRRWGYELANHGNGSEVSSRAMQIS